MWNVLNETVHKHVYTVNKQVLIKRRAGDLNCVRSYAGKNHIPPLQMLTARHMTSRGPSATGSRSVHATDGGQ